MDVYIKSIDFLLNVYKDVSYSTNYTEPISKAVVYTEYELLFEAIQSYLLAPEMSKSEYQAIYHPSKTYSEWFEFQNKKNTELEQIPEDTVEKPRK